MNGQWQDRVDRLARRLAVVAMTLAVIGLAVATVQVAAQWRASAAPLDAAPVGMDTIAADAAAEKDRAALLKGQLGDQAAQIAALRAVVAAADEHVTGDAGSASSLQQKLQTSGQRLRTVQAQLKAAQTRLAQLNAAADRQAALNAAARAAGAGSAPRTARPGDDEGEPDDH
jgi:hypothetical protein